MWIVPFISVGFVFSAYNIMEVIPSQNFSHEYYAKSCLLQKVSEFFTPFDIILGLYILFVSNIKLGANSHIILQIFTCLCS